MSLNTFNPPPKTINSSKTSHKQKPNNVDLHNKKEKIMKMETLYIIDPANFNGQIVNSMRNGFVDYMEEPTTFEQYKKQKGNNALVALTWEEFEAKYYSPYLKSLCGKFKRTTKAQFWDALECLPPKRWTRGVNMEFFFLGECYTANLYACFVRKGNQYFTALRPITTPAQEIFNLVS